MLLRSGSRIRENDGAVNRGLDGLLGSWQASLTIGMIEYQVKFLLELGHTMFKFLVRDSEVVDNIELLVAKLPYN